LETQGHRIEWIRDGQEAVAVLGGATPELHAPVILLDVDLPGLDGYSVLQRLARYGMHRKSRVIMLTVRSSEAEVVAALKLGAFDHVAKPFSLPVLIQRIRRAMEP
jgi:DNA-binding response OmpR family regulator